jgi:oxygen-independent coproporphyrinogen-3 oxidase
MNLVTKYNIQAPRYTSYPTVPYWDNNLTEQKWKEQIRKAFTSYNKEGISLYIHLPFCESLCTYCACNTRITVNHKVETHYINALLKEWQLYLNEFDQKPILKEIHLGGGTPTFFSPENLRTLLNGILDTSIIAEEHEFSFEGHPANTTREHLQTLFDLGFRRVSFGIQDFDKDVQETINRYQTFEEVSSVIDTAREIGYSSINLDIIYGLPRQTEESVRDTIAKVITLKPERIAYYSYAHVPWIKPGQRKYTDSDVPEGKEKRKLYEVGKHLLARSNYIDIGMDHFALENDELFQAQLNGTLHRNFMGYTPNHTKFLIGLGCSSISDSWEAFSQNIKSVEEYQRVVHEGKFPIMRGHLLTNEDLSARKHILNLMCRHESDIDTHFLEEAEHFRFSSQMSEFVKDGLAEMTGNRISITPAGKSFIRNICLAFDQRYWRKEPSKNTFSTTA